MKKFKKAIILGAITLLIGTTSSVALAASNYSSPAELVAGLTNRTSESVIDERVETGKSYGAIANEAGVINEFKTEVLEIKKDRVNQQVETGKITSQEAQTRITNLEENQKNCDGSRMNQMDKNKGLGFGQGKGINKGAGFGQGKEMNKGTGKHSGDNGMRMRDGSCSR
ncbi:MAG TPA: DUF2680 domain-containing protein [Syntrophomonadaceae bacterium]|nr:DUF2680 domain-containing protein [Syntrophomonadaceae bacterium]